MYPDDLFREFDRMFAELSLPLTSHARRGCRLIGHQLRPRTTMRISVRLTGTTDEREATGSFTVSMPP